eukprot:427172_1
MVGLVVIIWFISQISADFINLDENVEFDIYDIGIHIDSKDWNSDDNWYLTDTLYRDNSFNLIDKKCISKEQCYCRFQNEWSPYYDINKLKVFTCNIQRHSFASHLDFTDYESIYFAEDDDEYEDEYDEVDNEEMVNYNLKFNSRPGAPASITVPDPVRIDNGISKTGDCPVLISTYRVMNYTVIRNYWNWLIDNDADQFKILASAIADQIESYVNDGSIILGRRAGFTNGVTDIRNALIPRAKSANYNNGATIRTWNDVKGMYQWALGWLYQGPEVQVRGYAANTFNNWNEDLQRAIDPQEKWRALKYIYDNLFNHHNRDVVVQKIINYVIKGSVVQFNFNKWTQKNDATTNNRWKYVPQTSRRRLLEQEEMIEIDMYDSVHMSFNYDDWVNNDNWDMINEYDGLKQKCIGDENNCYCHITNHHYNHHNRYINAFSCNSPQQQSFSHFSAKQMLPNDFRLDATNSPKVISLNTESSYGTGRYCIVAPFSRHHIISSSLIINFWDLVMERGKLAQMLPLLQAVNTAEKHGRAATWSNDLTRWVDALIGGTHVHGNAHPLAVSMRRNAHGTLRTRIVWMKGNIFIGPNGSLRSDDPEELGTTIERHAGRIVGGPERYDSFQQIHDKMQAFVGNPAGTDDHALTTIATMLAGRCVWNIRKNEPQEFFPYKSSQWEIHQHKWRIKPL